VKRNWGNIPTVKLSIPSTLLTSTITPPGDYLMFILSPTFNAASEYRIMRVNGSKLETEYDFDGIKYITFGYAPQKHLNELFLMEQQIIWMLGQY
jgi:hypothetical protein